MNTLLNQDPASIKQVCLTDCKNTLEEFMAVVRYHAELIFSPEFCENIRANRRLIDRFLAENRAIYGVTTGFGENVRYVIPPEEANNFCHRMVLHGRALCMARKPDCENCALRALCDYGSTAER